MTFFVANFIIISLRFKGEREMIAAIITAVGIVIGGNTAAGAVVFGREQFRLERIPRAI